ncbi:MAG: hypothetical protein A4E56_03241 [Pelotomaculum sp. PtaU1.Bin065]|nr:MAG: hypothetical protein A4E56_03241 [Pelotomaculum sp. PtaU1.Bin065]
MTELRVTCQPAFDAKYQSRITIEVVGVGICVFVT